ncbi:hypothetical protein amyaer_0449 [Microcystis aeruginosa NIES-2481]|nr:hypothetical protein amyaer_0449 [Microcystis aeruginosa NIES-2481]
MTSPSISLIAPENIQGWNRLTASILWFFRIIFAKSGMDKESGLIADGY